MKQFQRGMGKIKFLCDRNCTWTIKAPMGNRVNLTFSHFEMEVTFPKNYSFFCVFFTILVMKFTLLGSLWIWQLQLWLSLNKGKRFYLWFRCNPARKARSKVSQHKSYDKQASRWILVLAYFFLGICHFSLTPTPLRPLR